MRIGILTYHCQPNFGAQLQAVSTVGFLRRTGHEVAVINWYAKDLEEMYSRRIPSEQILCHNRFAMESLPLSEKCQTEDALIQVIDGLDLDAIIAGSDALFKYTPLKKFRHFSKRNFKYYFSFTPLSCERLEGNPFFGAFVSKLQKHIPASTYAISSQNCPFRMMSWYEKRTMKTALLNYRLISVRDNWTKQMIESITKRNDICIYPDPVFSFNQNCYIPIPSKEEIIQKYNLCDNYVLLSFSDWHTTSKYIQSIAFEVAKIGAQPVALPMPEKLFAANIAKQIDLPLSPIDWYALIKHSKGFVGERMHPIVVCLHNAMPVVCFDEYGIKEEQGFFRKKWVYNPSSSKTNLIVSESGFQDNLYSFKGGLKLPDAQHVVGKLLSFDTKICKAFALRKQQEYEKGMVSVINSLMG